MKFHLLLSIAPLTFPWDAFADEAPVPPVPDSGHSLDEVAAFADQQVTGVTVSKDGRIFANLPFWSDTHTVSVVEVGPDGAARPYPNAEWNEKGGAPATRWVCVQSVVADDAGGLWVLDPAAPKMESIVPGGPKLVKFDLASDQPVLTIPFDETIAPAKSYLNDVRIDTANQYAYITESGTGALVVVDLKSRKSRRLLADHPSTKAEKTDITVEGIKVVDPKTGEAPSIHADGIAFDKKNGWLYYHALTGHTLYRIPSSALRDENLGAAALAEKVETVAPTPKPDGMLESPDGSLYLAALEENAVSRFDPASGKSVSIVTHKNLLWPDTLAWGPGNTIYVTTSQIHRMPKYHGGKPQFQGPFRIYRFKPDSSQKQPARK